MPEIAQFICYLFAFICFIWAAFSGQVVFRARPVNFVGLGLAFWVLVPLWTALEALD